MRFQLRPAILAEHFFLAVKFIERVWFEHDTFPVAAMLKAKEVPDFMRTFFCYPVNEVIVASFPPVILIIQRAVETTAAPTDWRASPNKKLWPLLKRSWWIHKEKGFFSA